MEIFNLILTQKIVKKMKKIKNHVIEFSSFFVDEKDVDFGVNTAENANDVSVAGNDFFHYHFYIFGHDNDAIKLFLDFLK